MAMEAVKLLSKVDAQRKIRELVDLRVQGGPSRLKEALEVAEAWGIPGVRELFETADRMAAEPQDEVFKKPEPQPILAEPKVEVVKPKSKPVVRWRQTPLRLRCLDHIFDPVRDYLDGLRWDGVR